MLFKSRGIIFRSVKYSETSFITDIYTEEKGLRSYIISGVRSKRSKLSAGLLQVTTLVDIVAYFRADKELSRIKELKAKYVYSSIPFDVRKSSIGLFMIEVARKTIQESEANPLLFEFLFNTFQFLDATEKPISNLHLLYLVRLSGLLGFMPGGTCSEHTPFFDLQEGIFVNEKPIHPYTLHEEMSQLLQRFTDADFSHCHEIKLDRATRKLMLTRLLDYFRLHIDNFPQINAHSILEEVLE